MRCGVQLGHDPAVSRSDWLAVNVSAAILTCLSVVTACSAASSGETVKRSAIFSYTCCRSSDVDTVYRPGDTVTIHWIATSDPSQRSTSAHPVVLTASLTGAFGNAQAAKHSATNVVAQTRRAEPIRTTDQVGGIPVSKIALPKDAAPGLYDLRTVMTTGGGSVTGAGIIRIAGP